MIMNLVSVQQLVLDTVNSLRDSIRRDVDENMQLEINYVDEIKRTISGKHRFVLSNLK